MACEGICGSAVAGPETRNEKRGACKTKAHPSSKQRNRLCTVHQPQVAGGEDKLRTVHCDKHSRFWFCLWPLAFLFMATRDSRACGGLVRGAYLYLYTVHSGRRARRSRSRSRSPTSDRRRQSTEVASRESSRESRGA
jgi:hypothetical protein